MPKPTTPSVPNRGKEKPKDSYSGYGADTVGPDRYIKEYSALSTKGSNFGVSKTKRNFFESSNTADSATPD